MNFTMSVSFVHETSPPALVDERQLQVGFKLQLNSIMILKLDYEIMRFLYDYVCRNNIMILKFDYDYEVAL